MHALKDHPDLAYVMTVLQLNWRVEKGSNGLRPGNDQPRGSSTPGRGRSP
jgi:hypothetical protein